MGGGSLNRPMHNPLSWNDLGVDVRGRSQTLRINYRTSHQIRTQADRLLDLAISDVDGNLEERKGTVSVFNGPQPTIQVLEDDEDESSAVSQWLTARISEGLQPGEIGLFVRSIDQIKRAVSAVIPNPPKDTDGRGEGSGRGWVRELQGRWPGVLG